jgi:hypothetical protein
MVETSIRRNAVRAALTIFTSLLGLILSLPIIALGLPFWVAALGTRWIAGLLEPQIASWQSIVGYDPLLGWKPKPNIDVHCCTEEVFHVTTGADGWRGDVSLAESSIVVLGDSFAFGYGVSDADMFAGLVPNARVKPIGAPGYNLVQELLLLRQYSPELAGKLVVWFVFLGNDLGDNLYPYMQIYRTPFVRRVNNRGDWQIETSHLSPKTRPYRFGMWHEQITREMLADLCSSTYLSERAYSACEFLIRKAQELCECQGALLCVLTVPDPAQLTPEGLESLRACSSDPNSFDPALPDQRIFEICSKLGVVFVAGQSHLQRDDYRQMDRHWTAKGHQRVAEILEKLYRSHCIEPAQIAR